MWVKNLVDLFVGEFSAFMQELTNRLTGLDCFLSDISSKLVANLWADCSDDTHGTVYQRLAALTLCGDAAYTVVNKGLNCASQSVDGLEQLVGREQAQRSSARADQLQQPW